jgi:hypothetical protein
MAEWTFVCFVTGLIHVRSFFIPGSVFKGLQHIIPDNTNQKEMFIEISSSVHKLYCLWISLFARCEDNVELFMVNASFAVINSWHVQIIH